MQNKAVKLSLAAVALCLIAAAALAVAMPWLTRWYVEYRRLRESGRIAILTAFYGCLPFALTALVCLWQLLQNIRAERVFSEGNSRLMAVVSWCCAAVAAVTLGAFRWYPPLIFITLSMAFLFLIVRVSSWKKLSKMLFDVPVLTLTLTRQTSSAGSMVTVPDC